MTKVKDKEVSQNMNYFIKEVEIDGKTFYAIMETITGKGGATNSYDLNLYFSSLEDAEEKLKSM